MSVEHFKIRMYYTSEKPFNVSAGRWAGMLKWYTARMAEFDGFND